ncbi:hypothetical protein Tco_0660541 [Tanacetum coccineum]
MSARQVWKHKTPLPKSSPTCHNDSPPPPHSISPPMDYPQRDRIINQLYTISTLIDSQTPTPPSSSHPLVQPHTNAQVGCHASFYHCLPEAIDKSAKAHLKKNVLPKDIADFHKIKQEKAAKQSMPKYSATQFDQETLDEYDQKDKLFKLMMKSMSYDKHPAYRALYDALVQSLIVDENDMDKQLEDPPTPKKRHKDQAGSSKNGKSPSKSSKTDKFVHADEIVHDVEIEGGESVKEDVVDADDPSQVDASAPKHEVNPEGDRIPHDLSKPLLLHGALGRLTILVYFFFNKDLDYLTTRNVEKKYATSLTKPKVIRYDLEGIEEMIPKL